MPAALVPSDKLCIFYGELKTMTINVNGGRLHTEPKTIMVKFRVVNMYNFESCEISYATAEVVYNDNKQTVRAARTGKIPSPIPVPRKKTTRYNSHKAHLPVAPVFQTSQIQSLLYVVRTLTASFIQPRNSHNGTSRHPRT